MAMKEFPLVSIITPVYNGAEYLDELIQSVLQQDYPNIEHLIIDDGSQDDGATVAILEKYSHLRWWSRANKGQYATMNEGLLAAQGEIVCFISADDLLSPGAIAIALEYLEKHPRLDGVFGITNFIDSHGKDYPLRVPFRMASIKYVAYFAHISHCSLYIKKSSLNDNDLLFNPYLRFVGDYDWMIRISQSHLEIGAIRNELSKVRIHLNQTSQKGYKSSLVEVKEVLEKNQVNMFLHFIFSRLYFLFVRLLKAIMILKQTGITGWVQRLSDWNKAG